MRLPRAHNQSDSGMLAQRWEKPSTALEERRTIVRARRLCKRKRSFKKKMPIKGNEESGSSEDSYKSSDNSERAQNLPLEQQKNFLKFSRMLGIRAQELNRIFETLPSALTNAIMLLDTIVVGNHDSIQARKISANDGVSLAGEEDSLECAIFVCDLDAETMGRGYVDANPQFYSTIAGMSPEEFRSRMDASTLPLPCSPLQFLCYFLDGTLCISEGLTSWTRHPQTTSFCCHS